MTTMHHEIEIPAAPALVFDYATTPAFWPRWHPSSLELADGADRPLLRGERFEEDVKAGLRRQHLSWTVLECEPHVSWTAAAQMSIGGQLRLQYRVTPSGKGTRFERTLTYELRSPLLRLYNRVVGHRVIARESRLSLQQLRDVFA